MPTLIIERSNPLQISSSSNQSGISQPAKRRALYLLFHYPSITEGYIEAEIRAVQDHYEVQVIGTDQNPAGVTFYAPHSPFQTLSDDQEIIDAIRAFDPQVIHAHRLFMLPRLLPICERLQIPFTVRSHAHDAIPSLDPRVAGWMEQAPKILPLATQNELCLGILAFPFTRPHLEAWGVPEDKIHDCYPVIDYNFLEMARRCPERTFDLYALPSRLHPIEKLKDLNASMGSPANIQPPVQPEHMPAEFKKHEWMIYTADAQLANVGWPVSIAEAQAAGVGVLMADIRPDLREYVGDAGFLYSSIDEALSIIHHPFPDDMRKAGFEHAKKSDVNVHQRILTDLWDNA
jgi:hypothetical protein